MKLIFIRIIVSNIELGFIKIVKLENKLIFIKLN